MAATRRLLARDGYDQVSIEAIARAAEVSRPTVYRRWPSKTHLVFDAVFDSAEIGDVLASSGDFEADLRHFVGAMFEFWRQPVVVAATLGILADRHRDPELYTRSQRLLDEKMRTAFGALVGDGVAQGVVDPDLDVDMAYDALVGTSFYLAHVRQPDGIDGTGVADRLCSLLLHAVTTRQKGPQ